jgi:hypothetical protein
LGDEHDGDQARRDRWREGDYQRVSGQSPPRREKRTVRNFGAVYCVVGDVLLGVVRFVGSCFVIRVFVGWRVAVCTPLLDVAVDTATSAFGVAVALCIYRRALFIALASY